MTKKKPPRSGVFAMKTNGTILQQKIVFFVGMDATHASTLPTAKVVRTTQSTSTLQTSAPLAHQSQTAAKIAWMKKLALAVIPIKISIPVPLTNLAAAKILTSLIT